MKLLGVAATPLHLTLGVALVGTAALGLTSIVTGAWFTDSDTITANTFTSGNVDLTALPAGPAITMVNMAPGDKVYGAITVANPGTLLYRYAVKSVTTENVLAAQLDMTIKTDIAAVNCNAGGWAAGVAVAYGPADLGSTVTGTKLIGDAAPGNQGDRTLAAAGSEVLCVQVTLPGTSSNAFASLTSTAVFTFDAEQTMNNP